MANNYFPEDEEPLPDVPNDIPEFPEDRREKGEQFPPDNWVTKDE